MEATSEPDLEIHGSVYPNPAYRSRFMGTPVPMDYFLLLSILAPVVSLILGFALARATNRSQGAVRTRSGRTLPMAHQAWYLSGRGVVLVRGVDTKNRKIRFTLRGDDGHWHGEDTYVDDLDLFLEHAYVAPNQEVVINRGSIPMTESGPPL